MASGPPPNDDGLCVVVANGSLAGGGEPCLETVWIGHHLVRLATGQAHAPAKVAITIGLLHLADRGGRAWGRGDYDERPSARCGFRHAGLSDAGHRAAQHPAEVRKAGIAEGRNDHAGDDFAGQRLGERPDGLRRDGERGRAVIRERRTAP